ncbi:TIGR03960 family B12-binding radical SAM protein [bacterium]|nr:MAG: TIGR03960 family B12-binding radical SAM protein [bacterium]
MIDDDVLLGVRKPARYLGSEWNSRSKDFDSSGLRFALCFPDLYEIGMSNLGIRIIYDILNDADGICCERFFAPDIDMENVLRLGNKKLFSLESARPLHEFDVVGFSLGYELSYTNILNMLELGGIPLEAALRGSEHPLVIGGGPCVLNPEPLHEFFDAFFVGEAEEAILEISSIVRSAKDKMRDGKIGRDELLFILSGVEGIYVPSFYKVKYNEYGKMEDFIPARDGVPLKIKKRIIKDLDNAKYPVKWLVPYIQVIHDRISLEVTRGCPNKCRFCQARAQYFPLRHRSVGKLTELAQEAYKSSGYEEVSLGGLSLSDYPDLPELLKSLFDCFKNKCVSISLPSIKPRAALNNIPALLAKVKKTGFTFAPEAGTQRLRDCLGKSFPLDESFKVIEEAYSSGYRHIKLYFMFGIPSETDEDLDGIIDFVVQSSLLRKKFNLPPAQINLSINALIPKPHTALQWSAMESGDSIIRKEKYIKDKLSRNKKVKISFHNDQMSFLEGIFSRGDRRLSRVVSLAFKKGARFDAWTEHFSLERWNEAFAEAGIDPNGYLLARDKDEILPWDFLDLGINRDYLLKEAEQILHCNSA